MITVVSPLCQSQNTQSVTADQRQSSAGEALPGSSRRRFSSHFCTHVAEGRLDFDARVT